MIPRFIAALLAGRPPVLFGDGEQSRDFTFVQNVVEAALLAIEADDVRGGVYNIACGESCTLNDLVSQLRALTGADLEPIHEAARPGDIRHSLADISHAEDDFGYTPVVGLGEGLQITVEHLRSQWEQRLDGLVAT